MGLAARYLEEQGIPTVAFGCARDIVERCGVPRFVFSDFPLVNPTGRPYDPDPSWKERVFTQAQPFLDREATDKWLARKERYRELRATGRL